MALCGFLLIDKPCGPTSMGIVRQVKRHLHAEHAGHLGTLDPFASGLLPVMIGGATRLSDQVVDGKKGYLFRVALGVETDTLDPSGRVVREMPVPSDWRSLAKDALSRFLGEIEQVPPAYSAIKMDGMALYEHMRAKGTLPRDIETKRRHITVHELHIRGFGEAECPWVELEVLCSKGTYVRSLARDFAEALGTVGHCSTLRRTLVEPWRVEDALPLNVFLETPAESVPLRDPRGLLPDLVTLRLGEAYAKPLSAGNLLVCSDGEFRAGLLPGSHMGIPPALFVGMGEILFYAEATDLGDGRVKVQPRKRLI